MKQRRLLALDDSLESRRVRHPEDAEARIMARRTNDGDGLGERELIAGVRVQIERGHEACLSRVGVDLCVREALVGMDEIRSARKAHPTERHQIAVVLELKDAFLVRRHACVGCTLLLGDQKMGDGESVVRLRTARRSAPSSEWRDRADAPNYRGGSHTFPRRCRYSSWRVRRSGRRVSRAE